MRAKFGAPHPHTVLARLREDFHAACTGLPPSIWLTPPKPLRNNSSSSPRSRFPGWKRSGRNEYLPGHVDKLEIDQIENVVQDFVVESELISSLLRSEDSLDSKDLTLSEDPWPGSCTAYSFRLHNQDNVRRTVIFHARFEAVAVPSWNVSAPGQSPSMG